VSLVVQVLDANDNSATPTNSARARLLVKEQKASWVSNDPPTIRLKRLVDTEIAKKMSTPITNWTDFFKTERDIYVQNIANAQISLSFEISPGNIQSFIVPHTRDPFNLTQHIPFSAIKSSADFRKMLNRRPAALQVMTEEEFRAYYQRKAQNTGKSTWEAAVDAAEERRQGMQNRQDKIEIPKPAPIHEVVEDDGHLGGKKEVKAFQVITEQEAVNPKVLHLCLQVNHQIADNEKMKAHALLEEFQMMEEGLKLDDFEYIQSHGYWKTVKNWAKAKVAELASKSEGADDVGTPATA